MTLGSKLTLWVLLPLLLVLILLATITLRRERETHERQAAAEVERIANTLAIPMVESLKRRTPTDLSEILKRSTLERGRFGVIVYDPTGHPFYTWGLFAADRALRPEDLRPLLGLPQQLGKPEALGEIPVWSHLIALTADGELLGALKVTMSLRDMQEFLARERNALLGTLAAITFILTILISLVIQRTVSAPLAQLMKRIQALASGTPSEDVVISGRDEVGQLSWEFNALARNLDEARRRLLEESEHARNVIQSITNGIIGVDTEEHIRTWSRAMTDRYGIQESEVLGRKLFDTFPALESEGLRAEVDRLLTNQAHEFELRYFEHETLRRGRVVLNIRGSALRGATDEVVGAVLAIEDMTDRVALSQEVQQAEKLAVVGQLAAGIAHQIGTPLNVISGSAEYLMMEWGAEKPRPQELEIIIAQTDRITKLIQQLLNFARPARMELRPLDLSELLREVLGLTEHQIAKGKISVETDLRAGLPATVGDANQLEQALLNIVINAWHAMPGGGRLTLRTRPVPAGERPHRVGRPTTSGVEAIIADTGTGIAPEHMPRIFDPFFSTKGVGKGTGLGLAISRRIVEDHHGSIDVASEVGQGTTFTIWLPAGGGTT
ncbi:MAG TPA: ATP-binding protein [Candidatus Methylomirabilis sp.]